MRDAGVTGSMALARLAVACLACCSAGFYGVGAAVCPYGTKASEQPWLPIAWRKPVPVCTCRNDEFCRGPYCTMTNGVHAFVAGCQSCKCLPECADAHDCWNAKCICRDTGAQAYALIDPLASHSPAEVQRALEASFDDTIPDPSKFLPEFQNPCWRQAGELRCLPAVYIAGILKCATSAVYDNLAKHDAIKVSYPKETHWWTRNRQPYNERGVSLMETRWMKNHAKQIEWTKQKGTDTIVLEGSASMFWELPIGGVMVPELVRKLTPKAKFVLMIRDPADRLYSDFVYFSYRTLYQKDPKTKKYQYNAKGFHLAVEQSIGEMTKCIREHSAIACAWNQARYHTIVQIQLGMYSEFFEVWMKYFPREQFLVIKQENLSKEPRQSFDSVTEFVGISKLTDRQLFGKDGQQVKQSNIRAGRKQTMLPQTRKLLYEFYAPYNKKLADLMGDPSLAYDFDASA